MTYFTLRWYRQASNGSFKEMGKKGKANFQKYHNSIDAEVRLELIYRNCQLREMVIETATPTMFVAFSPANETRPFEMRNIYMIEEVEES